MSAFSSRRLSRRSTFLGRGTSFFCLRYLPENVDMNEHNQSNFTAYLLFSCSFLIRVRYCVILSSLCLHFCLTKPGQYTSSSSICLTAFSRFLDNFTLKDEKQYIIGVVSHKLGMQTTPSPTFCWGRRRARWSSCRGNTLLSPLGRWHTESARVVKFLIEIQIQIFEIIIETY